MEGLVGHLSRLLDELARVEIVAKRAASDFGQLAIMAIGKDREVLPSWSQVLGQSSAGEGVGNRICGEARDSLLAVRDNRRPGRFEALDRIGNRCVLLGFQLGLSYLFGVISRVSQLQLERPRN